MEDSNPVSCDQVLQAERAALRPEGGGTPLRALCISGGGIRSATFALGALQRMAEQGLLQQFDYLSTVSGGGYIGGWLTAWIQRAGGLEKIAPALAPNALPAAGAPDPVEHLRDYNNYLTPRLGALSADTWTLAATVARNVFLNWLVFVPLLLAVLMIPRLWLGMVRGGLHAPAGLVGGLPWLAAALLTVGLWNVLRYLPGVGGINHSTPQFLRWALAPIVTAGMALAAYEALRPVALTPTVLGGLAPCLAVWLGYSLWVVVKPDLKVKRQPWRWHELMALGLAVVVLGMGIGFSAWLAQDRVVTSSWPAQATLAVPLLLLGFSLSGAVFVGLSSHVLGTQDREWMARAAAYLSMAVTVWLVGFGAVLLAPAWVWGHPWQKWGAALLGGGSGWASSFLGYRAPAAGVNGAGAGAGAGPKLRDLVLKLAPLAFLVLLAMGLAMLTDRMLAATWSKVVDWRTPLALVAARPWTVSLAWMLWFAALAWAMARYININKFSLQGMYRDRLIRAYLGASNTDGNANRFTGFATNDDLAMHCLNVGLRPLHVLNLTLNVVAGERLAWQQRKAEPFTVTALHCGSPALGYRGSEQYGGEGGITLGTAIATSGAAASPNMGYHSSPLVGFIMTLFNVRLGAWFGNPGAAGAKTWTQAGPHSAVRSLVREALGQTTDTSDYVYLSDGGHFENLAV
ncbi:MAG TPA: patatin-like phospholipase family protein, partial [Terriglobales bacterium]|nr:patatin-like phospholipase family protein [Terriglobales bacterium]